MQKVKYGIHHQAVADCPECAEMNIVDLGEDDLADGVEMNCNTCGCKFELESEDI